MSEVIDRFNAAFQTHNASELADVVAEDCVLENVDGATYSGPGEALGFWSALAADHGTTWTVEDVTGEGERATIRWRARSADGTVTRGVNLMWLRDGRIAEATGYVKIS
ncbi:nuclear transport factor 2 family protein [Nonomuraea sp. NPDC003727]